MLSPTVSMIVLSKTASPGPALAVKGFLRKRISTDAPESALRSPTNYLTHPAILLTKNSKIRRPLFLQNHFSIISEVFSIKMEHASHASLPQA